MSSNVIHSGNEIFFLTYLSTRFIRQLNKQLVVPIGAELGIEKKVTFINIQHQTAQKSNEIKEAGKCFLNHFHCCEQFCYFPVDGFLEHNAARSQPDMGEVLRNSSQNFVARESFQMPAFADMLTVDYYRHVGGSQSWLKPFLLILTAIKNILF